MGRVRGVSTRPELRAVRWIGLDGALIGGALALAAFVVFANQALPPPPWPPAGVAVSRSDLARDPLDPARTRNLGLALDRAGASADAARVMLFAGGRGRRDTPTEDWLLVRSLSEGRYDAAFQVADALLRRDIPDDKREKLFALLVAAARYDASRPALGERLALSPWWRLAFMRELAAKAEPADARVVLARLSTTANPPTDLELAPYLDRLVDLGAYRAAAADWRAFARPRRDPDDVNDLTAPAPFGWSPVFGGGASSGVDGGDLRVDYDGFATPRLPRRLIALAPGGYRLAWRERIDGDARLVVEVRCAGSDTLLASARPVANAAYEPRTLDLDVPASGCEGQWLAIAPIAGERRSPVTGVFSRWTITARPPR